jgi:hypothetical protein
MRRCHEPTLSLVFFVCKRGLACARLGPGRAPPVLGWRTAGRDATWPDAPVTSAARPRLPGSPARACAPGNERIGQAPGREPAPEHAPRRDTLARRPRAGVSRSVPGAHCTPDPGARPRVGALHARAGRAGAAVYLVLRARRPAV